MKKIYLFVFASVMMLFTACHDKIWDAIDDLDARVAKLEELCKEMNTNISSLQTIVSVLQENDYITGILPIEKGGETIGYTITFGKHDPITIYNGEDGKDGTNGSNGQGGYTPILGVAKDTDGIYYWTLNGEWLLDAEGNKVRVTGEDGKNGADGKDGQGGIDGENGENGVDGQPGKDGANGKDGITPKLKIENGYWYVSYDNEVTWIELGKAVGENGEDGKNGQDGKPGADGQPGKDGVDGDSMFSNVTYDENNVYFTLTNGTILIVPRGNNSTSDFDQTVIDNLVNSLELDKEILHLENIGDIDTIIATTAPYSTSKVIWTSSDTTIIKINNGVAEAVNFGDIKIKVQAGNIIKYIDARVGGPLQCKFSVGYQKYIYFSRGQLEFQESTNIYRFAINQYDELDISNGWNNKFSFPTIAYTDEKGYLNGKSDISNTPYDWGYNAISNGGNQNGLWRTITSSELTYLINSRENASSLYGYGNINGFKGLILLPDDWVLPEGGSFYNNKENTYGLYEWKRMEARGAVFLLTDSYLTASMHKSYNSNVNDGNCYFSISFSNGKTYVSTVIGSNGTKVRLIQDVK